MTRLVAPFLPLWRCLWQLPLSPSLHPSSRVLLQRTSLSFCHLGASRISILSRHSAVPSCVLSADLIASPRSEGYAFLIPGRE